MGIILNVLPALQNNASLPAAHKARLLDSFCAHHGWTEQIAGPEGTMVPNPETKAQFYNRMITRFVRESARAYEVSQAAETARAAKSAEVDDIDLG